MEIAYVGSLILPEIDSLEDVNIFAFHLAARIRIRLTWDD
jgi:hypothetical protein